MILRSSLTLFQTEDTKQVYTRVFLMDMLKIGHRTVAFVD